MKNAYLLMREIALDVELPGPKMFLIFFPSFINKFY